MILLFFIAGLRASGILEKISKNELEIVNLKKELESLKKQNSCKILLDAKKRMEIQEDNLNKKIISFLKTDNQNLGFAIELFSNYDISKEFLEKNKISDEILNYLLYFKKYLGLLSNETMNYFLEITEFLKDSRILKYNLDMIDLHEKISDFMEFLDGDNWDEGLNLVHDSDEDCKSDEYPFSEIISLFENDNIGAVFI